MTPLPDSLLEAVASAAVREGLADAVFTRLRTPIGRLLIVQGEHGIVRVGFEEEPEDHVLAEVAGHLGPRIVGLRPRARRHARHARRLLRRRGRPARAAGRPALVSAPFRRAVLRGAAPRLAAGQVVTYGALAERAGNARAYRAAATACARNPIPILVPCHRVLPSSGGIGAYGGGPERKHALLELEGSLPTSP